MRLKPRYLFLSIDTSETNSSGERELAKKLVTSLPLERVSELKAGSYAGKLVTAANRPDEVVPSHVPPP